MIHNGLPVQVDVSKNALPSIKEDYYPKKYTLCKEGDIAFADASEDTNDVGKAIEFNNCAGKSIVCGLHTIHGRDRLGLTSIGFKGYLFSSKVYHDQIKSIAQGTKVFSIKASNFDEVILGLPKKEEQKKISSLLMTIDDRILTQSKIIEEQETLLNSLADKMFLQNNFSSQLSELVNIEKGKQLNADTLSETGDYYVMNGGITPSGYYSEYNVPAGAISISEGGNSCGYVQFNEKPFWSGGHCYSLQCRTNLVDYKYIYYFLKTKEADVMALRIGSGLPNIQKKDIEKFTITYPSLQLQKQFVKTLDALSGKINTEKNLLEKYCQQKSYLLSKMFI